MTYQLNNGVNSLTLMICYLSLFVAACCLNNLKCAVEQMVWECCCREREKCCTLQYQVEWRSHTKPLLGDDSFFFRFLRRRTKQQISLSLNLGCVAFSQQCLLWDQDFHAPFPRQGRWRHHRQRSGLCR